VKTSWRDPVILVPIIVAVITSIVAPILLGVIPPKPPLPPVRGPQDDGHDGNTTISVATDKPRYVSGETVEVNANVGVRVPHQFVHLDVYDPNGKSYFPANNLQAEVNSKGLYTATFIIDDLRFLDLDKGIFTILATYGHVNASNTFEDD
jgi:hypothetical protein